MTSASQHVSSGSSSSPSSPPSASAPSPARPSFSATFSGDPIATAGATIRHRIHKLERSLEDALADGGALLGELVEARRAAGLSTVVGQPAFVALVDALEAVATARGKTTQAHKLLDRMGQVLGYNDPGYGDAGKDPFTGPTGRAAAIDIA